MKLTKLYFSVVILLCTVGEVVAQTQQIIIGNVTELIGKSAEPLIGVNINIMNSQERSLGGTVTNMSGQYKLAIPEKEKDLTLVFSYIGMKTQDIAVKIHYQSQASYCQSPLSLSTCFRSQNDLACLSLRRNRIFKIIIPFCFKILKFFGKCKTDFIITAFFYQG